MKRRAFFSFHYEHDAWRAAQIRNAGVVEGDTPLSDNDWESIIRRGDRAIQRWIDDQVSGKSCAIVLIGCETADRKWVKYEIKKAWIEKKGLLGIHVHNLKDEFQNQSFKGENPFASFQFDGGSFSSIVKTYDPPYTASTNVYSCITTNIAEWIEEAIRIRSRYK